MRASSWSVSPTAPGGCRGSARPTLEARVPGDGRRRRPAARQVPPQAPHGGAPLPSVQARAHEEGAGEWNARGHRPALERGRSGHRARRAGAPRGTGARTARGPAPEAPPSQVPQDFAILYEDAHLLVCDKPAGLPIHPGTGITGDTLVDQARAYLARQGLEVAEGEFKPSPAHRLDRETSGVVVVAKTRQAMVRFTEIFTAGEAEKSYLALAKGRFQREQGSIDLRLAERQQTFASKQQRGVNLQSAVTHWKKLAGGPEATLLEVTIETGRTHQIRRHLDAIGHPVVGDGKYGDFPFNRTAQPQWRLPRLFRHSARLSMSRPVVRKRLLLEAPLPPELAEVLPRAGIQWRTSAP